MDDSSAISALSRVAAPPSRWRNWVHYPRAVRFNNAGVVGPGDHPGNMVFPSADAAETAWLEWARAHAAFIQRKGLCYLGPIPEGERP